MLSKPMRGARPNRQHWSAKGLVGEWLFNEGCGTKAFDSSGNGNHGTLYNFASPATATSGWNASRNGVGLRFNGSNNYVDCGNGSSLNITDVITIKVWMKIEELKVNHEIICKHWGNWTNKSGYSMYLYNNYLQVHLRDNTHSGTFLLKYLGPDLIGKWSHIVFTYDGVTGYAYRNGIFKGGTAFNIQIGTNPNPIRIGHTQYSAFNGSIPIVELYNRTWSAKQVAWDYLNEYAKYQPRLTLAQLQYFVELGVITDPSILSLSVNRIMKSKTIDRTIASLTPERTFNLGV